MINKFKNNNLAKGFLGFAIIALFLTTFGVYNSMVGNVSKETALTVDGTEVPFFVLRDFANKRATMIKKEFFGGDTEKYDRYISTVAVQDAIDFVIMQEIATKYDILMNDDLVYKKISNSPAFYDETGKFSPAMFKGFLSKLQLQPNDFMDLESKNIANEVITNSIEKTALAKNSVSEKINNIVLNQYRDLELLKFSKKKIENSISVMDTEVVAYYNSPSNQYYNPSKAKYEYFIINDEELLANKANPTNAELEQLFNEKYKSKEDLDEVNLSYIKIDSEELSKEDLKKKIDEITAKLATKSFDNVAKEYPELFVNSNKMLFVNSYSQTIQDKIKSMKAGETSKSAVFTDDGVYFLKINDKINYSGLTLVAVKDELVTDWKNTKKALEVDSIVQKIQNNGEAEVISKYAKKVTETNFTNLGDVQIDKTLKVVPLESLYNEDFLKNKKYTKFDTRDSYIFVRTKEFVPPLKKELALVKNDIIKNIKKEKSLKIFENTVSSELSKFGQADLQTIETNVKKTLGVNPEGTWVSYRKVSLKDNKKLPYDVASFAYSMVGSNKIAKIQTFTKSSDDYIYLISLNKVNSDEAENNAPLNRNTGRQQIAKVYEYFLNNNRAKADLKFSELITGEAKE